MLYQVKIEKFEGPLDLLLELIKKQKLEITEISISKVASSFLDFVEDNEEIDSELLSDFLFIAAQLLLIKSKSLLPQIEVETEEELDANELEFRLKEYDKYKEKTEFIEKQLQNDDIVYSKQFVLTKVPTFIPGENATAENLQNALKKLISYFDKEEQKKEKKIEKTVSISEKMSHIKTFVRNEQQLNLSSLFERTTSKTDMVVTFLALLELVKKNDIRVKQKELFSDITIENHAIKAVA